MKEKTSKRGRQMAKATPPANDNGKGNGNGLPANRKVFLSLLAVLFPLVAGAIWYMVKQQGDFFDYDRLGLGLGIGLLAQSFNSALGMGYGVISSSFLLALGYPPLVSTATVHISEVFATATAALSHWYYGNIKSRIFGLMLVGGIAGALIGVYVVVHFNAKALKPYMSAYLLLMGLYILYRSFGQFAIKLVTSVKEIVPFAFIAGFVDAVGGGGWGSILTTTLLGQGRDPRTTIGSVNSARFFITIASASALFTAVGLQDYEILIGIIVSSVFVAPIAAGVVRHLPARALFLGAGLLISLLSLYNLSLSLHH